MEKQDLALIEEHMVDNAVLADLYKEHVEFEKRLEEFNHKPHLTPAEEVERKRLQKEKLKGRDMMESILKQYRMKASSN